MLQPLRPAKRMHTGLLVFAFLALVVIAGLVGYALAR